MCHTWNGIAIQRSIKGILGHKGQLLVIKSSGFDKSAVFLSSARAQPTQSKRVMSGPERGAHHTAFFTEFNGHSHALSTTAAVNENGSHCLTGGSKKKEDKVSLKQLKTQVEE